jgi:phosphoglycerate dehydrogenase-like enzyme
VPGRMSDGLASGMGASLVRWIREAIKKGAPMKSLTADQVQVGFIGLGNMGSRIARRLLDHGYQLTAYDKDLAKAEAVAAQAVSLRRMLLNCLALSMCFSPA